MSMTDNNHEEWLDAELAWDNYCINATIENWTKFLKAKADLAKADNKVRQEKKKQELNCSARL